MAGSLAITVAWSSPSVVVHQRILATHIPAVELSGSQPRSGPPASSVLMVPSFA